MKTLGWLAVLMLSPLAAAASQDAIGEAKRHYDAAAYEEALSTLTAAGGGGNSPVVEVEQYRALCFIALGRIADAERAVTALVAADPLYRPSSSVASPKVLSLIAELRAKALPATARQLLDSGRTAYTEKRFDEARQHFALLLRVIEDQAIEDWEDREDLRTLATGFATLTEAAAAPPPPPPAAEPKPEPPPPVVNRPIVAAVPLQEVFPTWAPDRQSARQEYSGTLRLVIGPDGRVKSAEIQERSHPAYDARVLQASRTWLYRPATLNGQAVESERLVTFNLRPPKQ